MLRTHHNVLFVVAILCLTVVATEARHRAERKDNAWATVEQGTLPQGLTLHIRASGGDVSVETTSGTRVRYEVRAKSSQNSLAPAHSQVNPYHLQTLVSSDGLWFLANRRSDISRKTPTRVVVYVPSALKLLTLEVNGGEVQIGRVRCEVVVRNAGGDITLADAQGSVRAETAGEDISIGSVRGDGRFYTSAGKISVNLVQGNVDAWTGAGSILVNTGGRNALLQAGAGDIRITNCGGQLKVASGGGNLVMGDVWGRADLSTNGGNIRLHSARGFVRAQTSGGNIELASVPAASAQTGGGSISATFMHSAVFKESYLRTNAGDITVYLPADLAITVDASIDVANGLGITSEFPEIHVASNNNMISRTVVAEGALNGGGPLLKLHVITGNIHIQKIPLLRTQ